MAKPLKNILAGIKASKVVPGATGVDPGVDYDPKPGDEQKFVALHSTEKHDDRVGNGEDVYNGSKQKYSLEDPKNFRLGKKLKTSEKDDFAPAKGNVKEAKESEEAKCNESAKGVSCPVHGMAECATVKKINENSQKMELALNDIEDLTGSHGRISSSNMHKYNLNLGHSKGMPFHDALGYVSRHHGIPMKDLHIAHHKDMFPFDNETPKKLEKAYSTHTEETNIDEVLTKKTSVGDIIHDFQSSKNPKFAGKSKEERRRMALGAYYSMHPEKSNQTNEDLAVPLLGGSSEIKGRADDTQEEIEMVKAELKAIANKALHILTAMPHDLHVEPWVQAKIAEAKSMINSVHDYMIYGDHGKSEEDEQADTPMTFPGMNVDNALGQNV
jgi:hypothetical protein